ncbi:MULTISPECIES: diacylglycerol/lipid kinase family protein [Actinomadura]|uniref:diacylglycerol/lipid kinase family protein n=1 Tax=Actinomadura TaxID=1988 RepID=UPI0003AD1B3F|nr:YegS/Rv2252/BmrU family lipid kinase [Actinomadura madurae]MCP9978158.1 diacylglycerol kinase family lipid kinase [Actinomadura madurae]URM94523.1 diacylglycerol kinase family lipid kinase [Actinomadura madurae]URN05236.1 diacylglycerol kinase family lipid kinase [Actinomadura madurae]
MRAFTAIVNPAAGGSAAASRVIPLGRLLRDAGAEVDVEYSRGMEHAASAARAAAEAGRVVLGVGGDGMVGCVGGALAEMDAGADALFGIVPAGRGNDFARQLGVPSGPDELARLLLEGEPRAVDAIDANGTAVLGSVYAGVDAVANDNANRTRLLRGSAAYYVGALRAIVSWRHADYLITVDGEEHRREGYTVVAANSGYYGFGRHIAPDARVDDGLLDVVLIRKAPKTLFFSVMRELESGAHVRRPEVEVMRGREVRIELAGPAGRTLPYGADGELPGVLPVTARVLPGALRVLAP